VRRDNTRLQYDDLMDTLDIRMAKLEIRQLSLNLPDVSECVTMNDNEQNNSDDERDNEQNNSDNESIIEQYNSDDLFNLKSEMIGDNEQNNSDNKRDNEQINSDNEKEAEPKPRVYKKSKGYVW